MQIAGYSDSGKTTVSELLVAQARGEGHVVGYIKHHDGLLERPGSDTDLAGRAGAAQRWLAGSDGSCRIGPPDELGDLLVAAREAGCSFVVVEGFKGSPGAKCWLRRSPDDHPPQGVSEIALDMESAEALALGAEELLRRMPRREI